MAGADVEAREGASAATPRLTDLGSQCSQLTGVLQVNGSCDWGKVLFRKGFGIQCYRTERWLSILKLLQNEWFQKEQDILQIHTIQSYSVHIETKNLH